MSDQSSRSAQSGRRGLFLSYHSSDQEVVARISQHLESQGISTFLDKKDLIAGMPWPNALEEALERADSVAVFLGAKGLGAWQSREMWFALDRQAQMEKSGYRLPVVPVLLPGAEPSAGFLLLNTWVDLRADPLDGQGLQRLAAAIWRDDSVHTDEGPLDLPCPYRGLQAFGEEDAASFFGRESFSERLFKSVLASKFVAVVGSSGSGKSSAVQAGLLPRLRRQRPPNEAWDVVSFLPGGRPCHRLAAVLLPLLEPEINEVDFLLETERLGNALAAGTVRMEAVFQRALEKSRGTDRILIVVDQFEELFASVGDDACEPFLEKLIGAAEELPLALVAVLRADFYGHALTVSRSLCDLLERTQLNLGPMCREELTWAIRYPAERIGLAFEPGLVERILGDMGEEPGNLPLLEFALTELWARRSGRQLTNAAYSEIGGLTGAVAQRAEAELGRLTPVQRLSARRVFTSLVKVAPPEEGGRDTRRRARLLDFDETARQVVGMLAGRESRLLVTGRDEKGEPVIELAHEILVRSWERLQKWLQEDRELLLFRERLRAYLGEHKRRGPLLSGAPLSEAERWLKDRREDLTDQEVTFIVKSVGARNAGLLAWLLITGAIALLGVIAGALGLQAQRHALEARAGSILTTQETIRDPAILAPLAIALAELSAPRALNSLDAVRFARRAAESALPVTIFRGHEGPIKTAVFSPDGTHVLTASADGSARVWRSGNRGEPVILQGHQGVVASAAFSPDGLRVLTGSYDGTARIWSSDDSAEPAQLSGHGGPVTSAVFSPDGSRVLTASFDRTARIWNIDDPANPIVLRGYDGSVRCAVFSSDGSRVLTGSFDGTVRIWNSDGAGEPVVLRGHQGPVRSVSFSLDGTRVLSGSDDGTARVWNADGTGMPVVFEGHEGMVSIALFSPDEAQILTGSHDGTARLWKVNDPRETVILQRNGEPVSSVAFSPDGFLIVVGSVDGSARIWSRLNDEPIVLSGHEGPVTSVAFSPDGSRILTASDDHTARAWTTRSSEPIVLSGHEGPVWSVDFSPNGSQVVTASFDSTARVWSANGSGAPVVLRGHEGSVRSAAFSGDGVSVVTASCDLTARVWKADGTGRPVVLRGHVDSVVSAAFSPDGFRVVTASDDGTARIWNADGRGQPVVLGGHADRVRSAAFSPDGSKIVTASFDGTARIWNSDGSGEPTFLRGHEGRVWSAAFSPDGSRIVTASDDRTARIWRAAGHGEPIVLRGHEGPVLSGTFSPDGLRVLTSSDDKTARIWNADGSGTAVVLRGHGVGVWGADFDSDGSRALTGSADGTARVWRTGWGALLTYLKTVTQLCLMPKQRMQYLGEETSDAFAAYEECQRDLEGLASPEVD